MDTKIFLQSFNSKKSSNTSEGLNVELKGKRKLLPLNDVADVISQYDQYNEERKSCNVIRLTCEINPICSNVLFNRISEIVRHEGSSGVTFINYGNYGYDDSGESYKNKESELFNGVVYKPNIVPSCWPKCPKPMEFWSSSTMSYESVDVPISNLPSTVHIENAVSASINSTYVSLGVSSKHPTNSIRDTQLSNTTSGFIYHCGLDIFNNHLIRSNTFKTVCRLPFGEATSYTDNYQGFNTIADTMRDVNGNRVVEKVSYPTTAGVPNNAKLISLHLYQYDDIYSFDECVKNRLIKKYNGWLGFENKSKIKSYLNFTTGKDEEMPIERPIMYANGGDFVDMYPSRDLYSFLPKYNNFRKRVEKNWNYCVTYPSSSYTPSVSTDPFGDIIECNEGLNSLKTIYFNENTRADNGTTQLDMYSIAKHGLEKGDYVNIYRTYTAQKFWLVDSNGDRVSEYFNSKEEAQDRWYVISSDTTSDGCYEYDGVEIVGIDSDDKITVNEKILDNAEVNEIVDDYIFTVFNSSTQISNNWVKLSNAELKGDISLSVLIGGKRRTYKLDETKHFFTRNGSNTHYYIVNGEYVNLDDTAQKISYKKVVNDIECDYYVRIFSKIPNFKFASGDTSNEYELYNNNEEKIHEYQNVKYDFESHASRLAFAKNVYTDNIGEIVFTDDIDISNLHDNLGRPLTSIYLTVIKNNKGYKEWYGYDHDNWDTSEIGSINVEYSHAFGKITCGIKTSEESRFDDAINCINKINNCSSISGYTIGSYLNESGRTYTIENNKVINIHDKEIWYDSETQFWGDLCYYDNYNAVERHIDYIMHRFNTAQRESYKSKSGEYFEKFCYDEIKYDDYDTSNNYTVSSITTDYHCNRFKEGYYYNPHYEIPIKTFGKLQSAMPDFLSIREITKKPELGENIYQITTLKQHFLSPSDKAILYYKLQNKYYNLVTISGKNDNYRVFTCMVYDEETDKPSTLPPNVKLYNYKLFKMDNIDAPSYCKVLKDGTCRVIWRDVLNNGFNMNDKTVEEYPFTNGAFYVNKRVELYLRRQDPHDFYGLYDSSDIEGNITDFTTEDNYIKEADIEC